MTPMQLTDLLYWDASNGSRPVSESDLLSVLTDKALISELRRRGMLKRRVRENPDYLKWLFGSPATDHQARPKPQRRYVTDWEPVGSVEEAARTNPQ